MTWICPWVNWLLDLNYTCINGSFALALAKSMLLIHWINNIILICRSICIKYLLQGCMPQIMQLQKGLSACNVLSSARENPALFKTVFVPGFCKKHHSWEVLGPACYTIPSSLTMQRSRNRCIELLLWLHCGLTISWW